MSEAGDPVLKALAQCADALGWWVMAPTLIEDRHVLEFVPGRMLNWKWVRPTRNAPIEPYPMPSEETRARLGLGRYYGDKWLTSWEEVCRVLGI